MSRGLRRLAAELKQTRPFRSRRQEGTLGLLRTADVVRRAVSAVIEPHGITLQQYNVLRILRGAGPEGLPTLEIAGRMIELSPGITRLLDRLEARRLVARLRCPKDRRRVLCTVTPEGLRLLSRLDAPVQKADDDALRMLSDRQTAALVALLDAVRAGHR
ncbi:MAG TPA: MarR family transcriptional regulator [Thermoanaerobaculia bacterium]|nr:MarR family transcriptional regulator [Thermoanaerobaculia bacterium]